MARWLFLLCMLHQVASQLADIVVKPDDYRIMYGWANGGLGNFQEHDNQSGSGRVGACEGATRLLGPGNAILAFRGTAVTFSVLMDSAGGSVSLRVGDELVSDVDTQLAGQSVTQNQCQVRTITKSGLVDQVWLAAAWADNTNPIYLQGITYTPSPNLVTTSPAPPSGDVQVLMNSSQVSYRSGGQPISLDDYATGYGSGAQGFWEPTLCGSYVDIWFKGSSASLVFTGTSATVNLLRNQYGGPLDIYLDGLLVKSADNYGSQYIAVGCDVAPVTFSGLKPATHNLTVINPTGGRNGWLFVQSFSYTPAEVVSAGGHSASKKSNGPIIGGAVGGVLGVLLLVLVLFLYRRRRGNSSKPNRTIAIDEEPDLEDGKVADDPGLLPVIKNDRPVSRDLETPPAVTTTTGIVAPETKSLRPLPSPPPTKIDAPPNYPSPSPGPPPPILPQDAVPQPTTTDPPPTSSLAVVQRLLDSGVPSTEIAAFIRIMEAEAGPSASRMAQGVLPPGYDFKDSRE